MERQYKKRKDPKKCNGVCHNCITNPCWRKMYFDLQRERKTKELNKRYN